MATELKRRLDVRKNELARDSGMAYQAPKKATGGRPLLLVTQGQIERLVTLGFSQTKIANLLGVSRTTLWRRMRELHIERQYDAISDQALDDMATDYRREHPYTGEKELIGHLRSCELHIQRFRIRESIHRTDPINTALRWHDNINRQPYHVPSPNSLWHIDSNLKLIRWGFVIQAGIDGYSRVIVYAKCSLNNRSDTVLESFLEAEARHGKPSRVRSDHGGENTKVAEYMLRTRCLYRGSIIITGPSNRNQRIERTWRDCNRSVVRLFSRIFKFMEDKDRCLELGNPIHMYCLQSVYLPRIQKTLAEWIEAWNNHPMHGCGNSTPLQTRETGFLKRFHSNSRAVRDVLDPPIASPEAEDSYGVEPLGESDEGEDEAGSLPFVSVARVHVPFDEERLREAIGHLDPLHNDDNYGIDTYKLFVEQLLLL